MKSGATWGKSKFFGGMAPMPSVEKTLGAKGFIQSNPTTPGSTTVKFASVL